MSQSAGLCLEGAGHEVRPTMRQTSPRSLSSSNSRAPIEQSPTTTRGGIVAASNACGRVSAGSDRQWTHYYKYRQDVAVATLLENADAERLSLLAAVERGLHAGGLPNGLALSLAATPLPAEIGSATPRLTALRQGHWPEARQLGRNRRRDPRQGQSR